MHGTDITARELDQRVGDDGQLTVVEDPGRDLVRPLPLRRILVAELVVGLDVVGVLLLSDFAWE